MEKLYMNKYIESLIVSNQICNFFKKTRMHFVVSLNKAIIFQKLHNLVRVRKVLEENGKLLDLQVLNFNNLFENNSSYQG